MMAPRRKRKAKTLGVLSKVRKPMAPPGRAIPDRTKYERAAEAERLRRLGLEDEEKS